MSSFVEPVTLTLNPAGPGPGGRESLTFRERVAWVRVVYAPVDLAIYAEHGESLPIREVRAGERVDIELPQPTATITVTWPDAPTQPERVTRQARLVVSSGPLASSGAFSAPVALAQYGMGGEIDGWYPLASGESVTNRLLGAALVDLVTSPVVINRATQRAFDVLPRRATRDYTTNTAVLANTRTQMVTLWNPGGATVELLYADAAIIESTAAAELWLDLVRITTTQPSGGDGATPVPRDNGAGCVSLVRRLPSTPGVEGAGPIGAAVYALGITGARPVGNPAPPVAYQRLWGIDPWDGDRVTIPANTGLAIVLDSNAAATVRMAFRLGFTER